MSGIMRKTLLALSENKSMYKFVRENELTKAMTRRFVAGEQLTEALNAMKELNAKGITGSLDLLGENVYSEEEARAAGQEYMRILDAIAESGLNTNVSMKLTQMGMDLSEDLCMEVAGAVIQKAKDYNNFVRLDMEGSPYTQRTLDMFRKLHAIYGNHVGIVLQAYLYRTEQDVADMCELGARVRLCKGAYLEPAEVAYPEKKDVDASYVRCMEKLLKDGFYPGLATHDEAIIQHAKDFVAKEGIGRERFEFQMLYGIRRDLQEALATDGYNMRCYVPFGTQWYPYFMRRLAERPANVGFFLRSLATKS
jgi:proline dehydrogenase